MVFCESLFPATPPSPSSRENSSLVVELNLSSRPFYSLTPRTFSLLAPSNPCPQVNSLFFLGPSLGGPLPPLRQPQLPFQLFPILLVNCSRGGRPPPIFSDPFPFLSPPLVPFMPLHIRPKQARVCVPVTLPLIFGLIGRWG